MKKELVEVGNLDAYICRESGKFYADSTVILTPGAKDELNKRGIPVVYGPRSGGIACPPGCTCAACTGNATGAAGSEKLVLAVAAILKEQYGIHDLEELKTLSCHVVKTIRENI